MRKEILNDWFENEANNSGRICERLKHSSSEYEPIGEALRDHGKVQTTLSPSLPHTVSS